MVKRKNILSEEEVVKRLRILPEVRVSDAEPIKNETWINRERILFIKSRGLSHRGTKLMDDLIRLSPHAKKDSTLDDKNNLTIINEIAEIKNCTKIMHFEARRNNDVYLWMSNVENGPSVKFVIKDFDFAENFKFKGNCLKASRPLLSFSADFDGRVELQFAKEMFTQVLGVPNKHPRCQAFFDRVYAFTVVKSQIIMRHYEVVDPKTQELLEIGPRMHMDIIKIFQGSLQGKVLYANEEFVTPNQMRVAARKQRVLDKIKPKKEHPHKKSTPGTYAADETDLVFAA